MPKKIKYYGFFALLISNIYPILSQTKLTDVVFTVYLEKEPVKNVAVFYLNKKITETDVFGKCTLYNNIDMSNLTFNLNPNAIYKVESFSSNTINIGIISLEEIMIKAYTNPTESNKSTLKSSDIELNNTGKDVPFMLQNLPSTIASSDAGNGVGYTDLRIRGTDGNRTNVTVNGVPINDAESHGTYWVNMPDLASSAKEIEVTRGVGGSINGAGAFGASINIQTETYAKTNAYFQTLFGSFGTIKNNIGAGTGWINNTWNLSFRLSDIKSNGFIDNSSSSLQSFYLSLDYKQEKLQLKYLAFGGVEKTQQAWNGVPIEKYKNRNLFAHFNRNKGTTYKTRLDSLNLFNSDNNRYNYYTYENETDNYQQMHNHMYGTYTFNPNSILTFTYFNTIGNGYFEQFRVQDNIKSYGFLTPIISGDTITKSDLVRKRWLKNNLNGINATWNLHTSKINYILGGSYSQYFGEHYGNIAWAQIIPSIKPNQQYYYGEGIKFDGNIFAKISTELTKNLFVFGDIQLRRLYHEGSGRDNDLRNAYFNLNTLFFNPKAGLTFNLNKKSVLQWQVAVAHKEPTRSDFVDNNTLNPLSERLIDNEFAYLFTNNTFNLKVNSFWMQYKNQLILTGALNDVGAGLRINVPNSYRAGIEIEGSKIILKKFLLNANITVSKNKIKTFKSEFFDYGTNTVNETNLNNVDIALSPNFIAFIGASYPVFKNLKVMYNQKIVGKQYLDNTQNNIRSLPVFSTGEMQIQWELKSKLYKRFLLQFVVSNLYNLNYATKGYTFGYFVTPANFTQEVYLFPQAGRNYTICFKMEF